MKPHKQLILSFDYELFLGARSGTVKKSIIIPTEKILKILAKYNHRAIFFIDTLYLFKLKEIAKNNKAAAEDFTAIENQLKRIADEGHEIFLHLHPHWIDAVYIENENQWSLSNHSRYKISSFSEEERLKMFSDSLEILKGIVSSEKKELRFDGYRAGGWSIQPFDFFIPAFEKYNIKYDFSVWRGKHFFSEAQHFDFRNAPKKHIYKFSSDVIKPNPQGKFTEIIISVISIPSLYRRMGTRIVNKFFTKNGKLYGDGIVLQTSEFQLPSHQSDKNDELMLSIEYLNFMTLPYYMKLLNKNNFLQFISHNKMLSQHNIDSFEKFMQRAYNSFSIESDFRKIVDKTLSE